MKILTGDDNGLLKCTQLQVKEEPKLAFKYGLQKENHEIDDIKWSISEEETRYCTFIHSLGVVKTYDTHTEKTLFKKELELDAESRIKSIFPVGDDIMEQKLIFAESTGKLSCIDLDVEDIEDQKQAEILTVKKSNDKKKLCAMLHRMKSQYLCLGQFLPQIFDIETKK